MSVLDVAHSVVHDYPGGAEALAVRLGMAASTLRSQVNPNIPTHVLGLLSAVRISQLSGDFRMLFSFASECGFVCMPCDGSISEVSPLMGLSSLMEAHGDVGAQVASALADGRVSASEMDAIEDAIAANVTRLHALAGALRTARRRGVCHEPA